MRIIKIIISSISMYSRLPVPGIFCDEDDMGHIITALPLIGAVIGIISYITFLMLLNFNIPIVGITLILLLIPLLITGGFHVDGFMDVSDALNSNLERKRKMEIMKDPHIGAFAVINLVITGIVWTACLYILIFTATSSKDYGGLFIYFAVFFFVRALCAMGSVTFTKAKKDGMLNMETHKSGTLDKVFIALQALLGAGVMIYFDIIPGMLTILGLFIYTYLYRHMCNKNFGGVTGDTAGYYVVTAERTALIILAVWGVIGKIL